jgi:hypothetical protein
VSSVPGIAADAAGHRLFGQAVAQPSCIHGCIQLDVSEVVQFRQDEERLERLRRAGLKPNEFARAAFERAYAKLVAEEAARRLEAASARGDRTKRGRPAESIHDARDELARRGR